MGVLVISSPIALSMYGIPRDLDFSFLIGSTITEVRQHEHDYVILKLDPEREVHIEGGRRLEGYTSEGRTAALPDLVERRIENVAIPSGTELVLSLSGGVRLRLFDDSREFECIQIYPEAIII